MDKAYWRLKKREQRAKEKGLEVVTVKPLPMDKELKVTAEYDADKYPDKKAFEVALGRVARAERYAAMFSAMIHAGDEKYQTLEWQYEHEGIPATKRPDLTK